VRSRWPQLTVAAGAGAVLAAGCILWPDLIVLLVWLVWLVVAVTLFRRPLATGPFGLVGTAAVLFVLLAALRVVPDAVHQAAARYRADSRFASYRESEAFEQSDWGVDPGFTAYLGRHLPRTDTFYVASGSSVATTAPQQWLQFELLPRIEKYDSPCSAKWVVFYARAEPLNGVRLDRIRTYRRGYAVGRVRPPCTT
jgi:hypothetical protein